MIKRVVLGEIAKSQTGPFGSQLHEEDYVKEGTPIVTVEHLGELGFTTQNLPCVSKEDVRRLYKYTLQEGDIVFSRVGSIDRNTYVTKAEEGWMFSGRCIRVRCNKEKVNPLYLSYYFKLNHFKRMMLNFSIGAIMPSLNTEIMDSLPLDLLERSEQDKIANSLFSIDEKIRNNTSICFDLESMAKIIYDYWFIQFDFPDENGKPYKSSGGKMVWNEELKREIPEGWEVNRLGSLIKYNRGVSYTGSDICSEGTPIISLASIDRSGRYIPEGIKYYNQDYPASKVLKPYDLVMANTDMTQERAVMGKIIFVPDIFDHDVLSTHHITKITVSDNLKSYLMMTTQTDWFHKYIKGFSSGTNVLGMDMVGFEDFMLLCPSKELLIKFNRIIYSLYAKVFEVYKENFELASLRDFLLPMLMNGQVKVKS